MCYMKTWLGFSKLLWEYEIGGAAPEGTGIAAGTSPLQDFVELIERSFRTKTFLF